MAATHPKKKKGSGNGFQALGLSDPVYKGIVRMGFRMPTPVQRKALPVIFTGADTVVMARTGSGKTCAFLIPILEKLLQQQDKHTAGRSKGARAVILSPTRELSLQTQRVCQKLSHFCNLKIVGITGGQGMEAQFEALSKDIDILIATPGRLSHHLSEIPDFSLGDCQMCVLDEADRLLEMGFATQIREITKDFRESAQFLLLSATMPKVLVEFTSLLKDPQMVRLDSEATVSADLRIAFLTCRSTDKDAVLLYLLQRLVGQDQAGLTLIFAATRHHVEYIHTLLTASHLDATLIYGSLDHEARQQNLSAFRSGRKPILVVTDVAARGIDVPLVDHVVHYHFPPNAKLFVHRSGRAARVAGRNGYCWGLVEPDEMAYMVDLYLFLGRPLQTTTDPYAISDWTPEMVHYGSTPETVLTMQVENVRRVLDSELSGSIQAEAMKSLQKVCNNAMKQYRRTRPEASREGVRRAKEILEGERLNTGERVNKGIPTHPLLRGWELETFQAAKERNGVTSGWNDLESLEKRQDFLRAVANFRPKETVFEAFGTNKGKDPHVVSQVDKGRTTSAKAQEVASSALVAMKNMRRQMRIARDKGGTLVVAGSAAALEINEKSEDAGGEDVRGRKAGGANVSGEEAAMATEAEQPFPVVISTTGKRRMSKAERRRFKKNPQAVASSSLPQTQGEKPNKVKRGADFRDPTFFIDNDFTSNTAEAQRKRQIEAAMQPSASSAMRGSVGAALRMEEAMLDIVGDENEELVQKQRMMRWDKSKRKYVQTTVGSELRGGSKSKKIRLESGQLIKGDKMKLGELYEKWQKKTNRSIGRNGVFDEDIQGPDTDTGSQVRSKGGGDTPSASRRDDSAAKTALDIKKERARKDNLRMKNMQKGDRRRLEQQQRLKRNTQRNRQLSQPKKQKGPSGRWKGKKMK